MFSGCHPKGWFGRSENTTQTGALGLLGTDYPLKVIWRHCSVVKGTSRIQKKKGGSPLLRKNYPIWASGLAEGDRGIRKGNDSLVGRKHEVRSRSI